MPDANPSSHPLAWPSGWPRTPATQRRRAAFSTARNEQTTAGHSVRVNRQLTVAEAINRLQTELDRIGARYPVVSSNLELRLDGMPRAGQREPTDPGVAVYFQLRERPTVMPCDRYTTIAGNIAAIAAHIEATRAIARHGVGTVEQMFTAFQALRGPGPRPWREVLGIKPDEPVSRELILLRRRALARQHHPDAGGSDAAMAEINEAAERAMGEIGGGDE